MKKITLGTAAFLMLLSSVIVSCKKDTSENAINEIAIRSKDEQKIFDYLVTQYKFKSDFIHETDDAFIVEGDIVFPKEFFWKNYQLPDGSENGKHYKTAYKVSPSPQVINVGIDPNLSSVWRTAYANAINEWNALGGKITFKNCQCSPLYGVWISGKNLGANLGIAYSIFPTSNGKPGATSTVNLQYNGPTLTASQKLKVAVHELGHTIGFGHTDDSSSGSLITTSTSSCNTGTNSNSVMVQGQLSFGGFSNCDKAAFKALYP